MDATAFVRIQSSRAASTCCACTRAHARQWRCLPQHAHASVGTAPPFCAFSRSRAQRHNCRAAARGLDGDLEAPDSFATNDNKSVFLKYVTDVEPSVVESFQRTAPWQVADAIKVSVVSLVGSLPPQFFEVNIVTLGDNLRSLMYSFLMTGYLYRHIVDHLDLRHGIDKALPGSVLQDDLEQDLKPGRQYGLRSEALDGYAKGTKLSEVDGQVTRWHYQTGLHTMRADEYIGVLEQEVEILREQLKQKQADTENNELISYLKNAPSSNAHHVRAGQEVTEAMEAFMQRLLGTDDQKELTSIVSETTAPELHRLLSWLTIVGYTLRSMEVRFSIEQSYALPYVALEDKGRRENL